MSYNSYLYKPERKIEKKKTNTIDRLITATIISKHGKTKFIIIYISNGITNPRQYYIGLVVMSTVKKSSEHTAYALYSLPMVVFLVFKIFKTLAYQQLLPCFTGRYIYIDNSTLRLRSTRT